MSAAIAQVSVSADELALEVRLFCAFCTRIADDPQEWSVATRRQFRKRIAKCRKCCKGGAA